MGSVSQAAQEAIDYLMEKGEKVGIVSVHLYRPFSAKHFLAAVPKTAKRIAVLDRTKEPGANGEPLYLDVKDCFYGKENAPLIVLNPSWPGIGIMFPAHSRSIALTTRT